MSKTLSPFFINFFKYKLMADLKLDFLVIPTYNTLTLAVADSSIYPTDPPEVISPTIEITIPGFNTFIGDFVPNSFNVYTSSILGITDIDCNQPLPDGVYTIKYSVAPAYDNYVVKSILRVERLLEKFDNAFLKLDLMECDNAIKTQSSVTLNTINFFIQGAIASANNCAEFEANKLYIKADSMLDTFLKNDCGCSGNNYQLNFY